MNKITSIALLGLLLLAFETAFSCTRILVADKQPAVMVGRNMDWIATMPAHLRVYPRGIERNGETDTNSLHWTSRYGSVAATVYDDIKPITTDGMNEKGLAAHILSLAVADFGKRNESVPGLGETMWVQYYLDNFATVSDAVNYTQSGAFQVVMFHDPKTNRDTRLHLALEDATGDSAIIEYVGGQLHIYHDKSYQAMTNDPVYPKQLNNLENYAGFGGSSPLPGTHRPSDRFVRATYYAKHLPQYTNANDELSGVLSIIQNVTQPKGSPSKERPIISKTIWRTISDLTNKRYYFTDMGQLGSIYIDLLDFDLSAGHKVMYLDTSIENNHVGNVKRYFSTEA